MNSHAVTISALRSTSEGVKSVPSQKSMAYLDPCQISFNEVKIGGYLGSGSHGEARMAYYQNNRYAAKLYHDDHYYNNSINELNAWKAINRIGSPYLMTLKYFCIDTRCPVFIMDQMKQDLRDYVKGYEENQVKPLTWQRKIEFLKEVTHAVVDLHDENYIHKDIKARNYLVNKDGHVKLGDFESAEHLNSGQETVRDHYDHGTYSHMAPESFNAAKYSKASDVYSLGMTFWEIITNAEAFPFAGLEYEELKLKKEIGGEKIPANCPPKIAHLLGQCWQKLPEARPTARDVLTGLENLEADSTCYRSSENSCRIS